jgi:hypothetical protein
MEVEMLNPGDTVRIVDEANFYFGRLAVVKRVEFFPNTPVYTVHLKTGSGGYISSAHKPSALEKII